MGQIMRFVCPHCFKDYTAPDEVAGSNMTCLKCSRAFTIPSVAPPPPSPVPRRPANPPADEEEEDDGLEAVLRRRRSRQANRRARAKLLIRLLVVTALGIAAYFASTAAWEYRKSADE